MMLNDRENASKENLKGLMSNSRTRSIIIVTACILAAMIIFGLTSGGAKTQSKSPVDGAASVNVPVKVTAVPGTSDSADYNKLQEEANRKALEDARSAGTTFIPVPTATNSGNDGNVTLPQIPDAAPVVPSNLPAPPQQQAQPVQQVTALTPVQSVQPSDKVMEQIEGYLSLWGPQNNAELEFSYVRNKKEQEQSKSGQSQTGQQSSAASASKGSSVRFVRAGTMLSARLITPLNSDTPGPVLAEITSGQLAGARLIGTMSLNKEAILIKFEDISKPGWPASYSVNAVGMDDRFSTAIATDVNHHYFKRYAGLLGGSFIEAYGKAMSQTGQTIVITDGNIVSDQPDLTTEQIRDSATGGVLSAIGSEMKKASNEKTTVKVESKDGFVYIRVLFMDDF